MDRAATGLCRGSEKLPAGSVDLAFADPPFNIGYDYDVYDDRKTARFISTGAAVDRAGPSGAEASGTFWLAIGDEFAAELKLIARRSAFIAAVGSSGITRSASIARISSAVRTSICSTSSRIRKVHLSRRRPQIRVPSARQLVYGDSRANPHGRLPDDTWILRPQDLSDCFTKGKTPGISRAWRGRSRSGPAFTAAKCPSNSWLASSAPAQRKGTRRRPVCRHRPTLVVAKKLGRRSLGFELSEEYARRGLARLEQASVGDSLEGSGEPARECSVDVQRKIAAEHLAKP